MKVYFMVNVIMVDEAKKWSPCLDLIKAGEDTYAFNIHPWSNVVWENLIDEVRKFAEKVELPSEEGKKKRKLNQSGFVELLQV